MLSKETERKIVARVTPLLCAIDPDLKLHRVILDSTRQQLAFIAQKGDQPFVLGLSWLDYVSHRDEELKKRLAFLYSERIEATRVREAREE